MTDAATRFWGSMMMPAVLERKVDGKGPVEAAQIEAHHFISIEVFKRVLKNGHTDDPCASAANINDTGCGGFLT